MALTKVRGAGVDFDGQDVVLDADGDTKIAAGTDDIITVSTAGTERVRVLAGGGLDLSAGNLVLDNGYGIEFTATANSSGTVTHEILDDYEIGTFTPNLTGASGGEASYSVREGSYTKVGRLVVAHVLISLSSKNTLSGSVQINNLPFTVSNLLTGTSVEASGSVGYFAGLATAASSMVTFPVASTTNSQFHFVSGTSSTAMGSLDTGNVNNDFNFRATVTYFTA